MKIKTHLHTQDLAFTEEKRRERLRFEIIVESRQRAQALRAFACIGSKMAVPKEVAEYYAEAGATFAMMGLEARGVKL